MTAARPPVHNADLEHLPEALRPLILDPRWVNWEWRLKPDGKWTKPPLNPSHPGRSAKNNTASTWGSYSEAVRVYEAGNADGIGYMLQDKEINAIDLDKCRVPATGKIAAWAKVIVDAAHKLGTYVEVTVSGTGLRIIGLSGSEADKLHRRFESIPTLPPEAGIELYRRAERYITISGLQIGDCAELVNIDPLMGELAARLDQLKATHKNGTPFDFNGQVQDSESLIRNGVPEPHRSEVFQSVVWQLAWKGLSPEQITAELEKYPNGIAAKYIKRLPAEVRRSYDKWRQQNRQESHTTDAPSTLESRRASDIKPTKIVWLWPGRFARKKIGVIGGQPDEGKSLITIDMAAAVSRGRDWPCGEGRAPLGNVIILSAEDDPADTLVPRLMAADADLQKVHIVQMVQVYEKIQPDLPPQATGQRRMFSLLDDLKLLERKIEDVGSVVLVIIDPMTAYLGVKKMDSYRTSDVRGVLAPLAELAAKRNIAVISVMHFNKNTSMINAMNRISDSVAFVAAARHAYVVMKDPEIEGRHLFLKAKNNLAADTKGLAYAIETRPVDEDIVAPCIAWSTQHISISADEALAAAMNGEARRALDEAGRFLAETLADGPVPTKQVEEAARAHDISKRTLARAKKALGVVSEKTSLEGGWTMRLPGGP